MKKTFLLFAVLFAFGIGLLQPYSLNLKNAFAETNEQQNTNCAACQQVKDLTKNKTNKLNDNKIINKLKKDIKNYSKNDLSIYDTKDFEWKEGVVAEYADGTSAIMVPSINNPKYNDKKEYLAIGYSKEKATYTDPTFISLSTKDSGKTIVYSISSLDGEKIVSASIDAQTGEAIEIDYPLEEKETALVKKNSVKAGYWDRVQDCIQKSWKTMPSWVKFVCGSACGGCIFASPYACGGCLGCLGGYAIGCSLSQI